MYAQELLVHEGSERQAVEGIHTGVVHPLRILNSTCHGGNRANQTPGRSVLTHKDMLCLSEKVLINIQKISKSSYTVFHRKCFLYEFWLMLQLT